MSEAVIVMTVTTAAFLVGPLVCVACLNVPALREWIAGLTFVCIGGLALFVVGWEAVAAVGLPALVFLVLGLALPWLMHQLGGVLGANIADAAIVLGLAVHVFVESAALGATIGGAGLIMAVLVHRLPVSFAVFSLGSVRFGWLSAAVLMLASITGFSFGSTLTSVLSVAGLAYLQAFVAGSLLHVLTEHQFGGSARHNHSGVSTLKFGPATVTGAATGLVLVALAVSQSHAHENEVQLSDQHQTALTDMFR
ncbi:MAG: hypothetical protein AAF384_14465 [Pseudomonadota bacterium]